MKLTKEEFENQLKLAKSLPTEQRKMMIASLKSATVVEVDEKGVETEVDIQIVNIDGADTKTVTDPPETDIEQRIQSAVEKAMEKVTKDFKPAPPFDGTRRADKGDDGKVKAVGFRRTGQLKNFAGARDVEIDGETKSQDADLRAYRFGVWGLAVLGNEWAKSYCADHGIPIQMYIPGDNAIKVAGTNVNNNGGVLVPEQFGTDIIVLRERNGVVRRIFKNQPMDSDTRTDPRQTGGLTAFPVLENAEGTESDQQWDNVRLTAKDWMVLSRMSNQISADAIINFGDNLAGDISYAFALKEDQTGLIGTGTAAYHGIVGIGPKLLQVYGTGGGVGLIQQSGNAGWTNLILGDFDAMVGALPQYADTPSAVWVCHRSFYYGVCEKLVQASGGVPASEVREGNRRPRPIFKGYPVEFAQVMPASYATQTIPITLGDHSLAASFGDRQQDAIAFSDSATIGGESVFARNQMAIRGTSRWDINVHDVGSTGAAGPVVGLILK